MQTLLQDETTTVSSYSFETISKCSSYITHLFPLNTVCINNLMPEENLWTVETLRTVLDPVGSFLLSFVILLQIVFNED